MIRHISAIAEVVDDVDAAVEFYRDVLGLSVDHQPGGGYATVEIPGTLHFSVWSRSAAAEATYGDKAAVDRIPLGFSVEFEVDSVNSATDAIGERGWQSRSAAEEGVVGPSDEPLHAPERNARRLLGNAVGPSNHSGPQGSIRVIGSLYVAIDLPVIDTSGGIQCYTKCVRYS